MPDDAGWIPRQDAADPLWVQRYDRGALLRPVVRADGTMLVEGFAAREGVLEYRQADGSIRRELVTRDTLEASAAGLARAPVTLEHPREDVSPANVGALGVGDTDGEVRVEDGGFVRVRLAVRRADAIAAIRAGKQELSPGYAVRLDATPGTHPVHGRYDAVQAERRYNHLALVDAARGGAEVRIRADSATATTTIRRSDAEGARMNPSVAALVAALGLTQRFDSDESALSACLSAVRARKDEEMAEEEEAEKELEDAKAAVAVEKERADKAEAKLAALQVAEAARVDAEERKTLDALALALGVDPKPHADSKALRRAIASKHLGAEVKADAEDAYVRGVVDVARADAAKRGDGRAAGSAAWAPRDDGQPPPRATQRKDSRQRYLDSLGLGGSAK